MKQSYRYKKLRCWENCKNDSLENIHDLSDVFFSIQLTQESQTQSVSWGPHETESKIWQATLKNEEFF